MSTSRNILVACEFSGIVTQAFRDKGHNAISIDLLPTEGNVHTHLVQDVIKFLEDSDSDWDLMIAFPPCTHLAVSGARWFPEKIKDGRQQRAIDFFMKLVNTDIPRIAIENPIGIMSTKYRKPDQIIQPYEYGQPYQKSTCLWLKDLPKLEPSNIVDKGTMYEWVDKHNKKKRMSWFHYQSFGLSPEERTRFRNRFPIGIAEAMAEQWGNVL